MCTRITAYTVSYFDNLSVLATILFLVIFGVVFFSQRFLYICRVGVAIYVLLPVHLFCGREPL